MIEDVKRVNMEKRTISVSEIFGPTVQGEGELIGKPTVFVRTGGCDYRCLAAGTLVTLHDLTQKPIELVRPGDIVLGYAHVSTTTATGPLRLVPTPVLAARSVGVEPTVRLIMDDGTEVLCSRDHRWWVEQVRNGRVWKAPRRRGLEGNYREAQDIRPGNYIKGFGLAIHQPCETESWRRGYLRGAFDGDGHVSGAVAAPLAEYTEVRTTSGTALYRSQLPEASQTTVMEAIEWQEEAEANRGMNQQHRQVIYVEAGDPAPLFDIQTGTENFLANGMVSHNCSWCDTLYAVLPEHRGEWTPLSTEEVFAEVQRLSGGKPILVTLSGGNPAMQPFGDLIDLGHEHGYTFALETQGSIAQPWFAQLDYLTLSPKPPSSKQTTRWERLDRCISSANVGSGGTPVQSCLKIIIFDDEDYAYAKYVSSRYPTLPVYLQAGNHTPPHLADEIDISGILDRLDWLIQKVVTDQWYKATVLPQLHTIIWGNRRGV